MADKVISAQLNKPGVPERWADMGDGTFALVSVMRPYAPGGVAPLVDSFGRERVSSPQTLFDAKQIVDNLPLFFDDAQVSGSGTGSTHSAPRASTTISVSASTTGKRVRQTKRRFNYQPGKSQLATMTFVMDARQNDLTQEVGLFDDDNGLFFRQDGNGLSMVVRSSVTGSAVDNAIAQDDWNIDTLRGDGASGITLDETKALIFFVDFEWLGVGAVAFGFIVGRQRVYCHIERHANVIGSVYMSTPNLPVRYSIENGGSAGAAEFETICSSVISEGGQEDTGVVRSIDRATDVFTTQNDTSIYPLISIRLKATHLGITVKPLEISVVCGSTANFRVVLLLNPTVAGVDQVSWTDLANSAVQFDISRDNTNTLSGGTAIWSAYVTQTNQGAFPLNAVLPSFLTLGSDIDGTRDELVLAVQNLAAGAETYSGGLNILELL